MVNVTGKTIEYIGHWHFYNWQEIASHFRIFQHIIIEATSKYKSTSNTYDNILLRKLYILFTMYILIISSGDPVS